MDELIQNAVSEFKIGSLETPALEALQNSDIPVGAYMLNGVQITINQDRKISITRRL